MRFSTLFVTASALTLSGCMSAGPVDPAISQQEAQQAYQQHPAVLQEFGGEVGGAVGSYVEQVGDSVAVHSGTPNAAALYDFTVLSSAVENAFAVFFCYSIAVVCNFHDGTITIEHGPYHDMLAFRGGLNGICYEVQKHLLDSERVCGYQR